MFSSARSGPPAAISPTSGRRRGSGAATRTGTAGPTGALAADDLEGARLGRVAAQHPGTLEIREVRVHRRGRGEAHLLADLAHGRWIPVLGGVADDEVVDLLLALAQHARLPGRTSVRIKVARVSDGVKLRPSYNALRALVAELVDAQG